VVDFDPANERVDDFTLAQPVEFAEALCDPRREFLQLADHK
jgi:hypothetical protein